jgi:hypothetical protein
MMTPAAEDRFKLGQLPEGRKQEDSPPDRARAPLFRHSTILQIDVINLLLRFYFSSRCATICERPGMT